MILFPIYSLYWTYTHIQHFSKTKRTSPFANNHFSIPKSVILVQLSLIIVGIGSWMFHMTLLYHMQLLDELPMIYGTAIQVNFLARPFDWRFLQRCVFNKKKQFYFQTIQIFFDIYSYYYLRVCCPKNGTMKTIIEIT